MLTQLFHITEITPLTFTLITFGFALLAGVLGSLLGIGGGIIVTPALTLVLGIEDIRLAFGASIICVIATSAGSAASYVKKHMTNFRVAILLQLATAAGGLTGAILMDSVEKRFLYILFGIVMAVTAYMMLRKRHNPRALVPADRVADKLRLHDHYYDQDSGEEIYYRVTRTKIGFALMYCGGILSGLLGIGAGVIAVPTLSIMRLPFKICTATSNLMMGVTAAASAGVYFARGHINPFIAAPVAAGVLIGAIIGTRLMPYIHTKIIRILFVVIILIISYQMFSKGLHTPSRAERLADPQAATIPPTAPAATLPAEKGPQP